MDSPAASLRGAALGIRVLFFATVATALIGLLFGLQHAYFMAMLQSGGASAATAQLSIPRTALQLLSLLGHGAIVYGIWCIASAPVPPRVATPARWALGLIGLGLCMSFGYLVAPDLAYRLVGGAAVSLLMTVVDVVAYGMLLTAVGRLTGRLFDGVMLGVLGLMIFTPGLVWLVYETPLRSLVREHPWTFFALRQPLALAMNGLLLYVLARAGSDLARLESAGPVVPVEAPPVVGGEAESGQRMVLFGGLWLGGGLIVTIASYSAAAASSTGGRYMVAYGAVIYGAAQIIRGLSRLGR